MRIEGINIESERGKEIGTENVTGDVNVREDVIEIVKEIVNVPRVGTEVEGPGNTGSGAEIVIVIVIDMEKGSIYFSK